MPIKTVLTEMLGIEHPIIQGGMHYVGYAEMAAAVSNAGGLGIITALTCGAPRAWPPGEKAKAHPKGPCADALREEIRRCKALTSKPFGVNLTLLPVHGRQVNYKSYVDVIAEEGIKAVETAGRSPAKVIKMLKEHNIIVIHKCVAVRHAISAARMGADVISMDGFECGGHPGEDEVGNWVLLAKAQRHLKVPFVVSGGCSDGHQLAAALALGAVGMNMGTRFMATKEAPIHDNIKQALVKADERGTELVLKEFNNTERTFKNATTKKLLEVSRQKDVDFGDVYPYVKGDNYRASFQETGDTQSSVWSCGQVMGLITDVPSCAELVSRIVAEAEEIISSRLPTMVAKAKL